MLYWAYINEAAKETNIDERQLLCILLHVPKMAI